MDSMDPEVRDALRILSEKAINLWDMLFGISESSAQCFRLLKVVYLLTPIVGVVVVYNSLKYLLIYNAQQYEDFVRRKRERTKKLNKRLKILAKRYGNLYFCYMPMNHGTVLPRTYSLFMAIRDVLTNSERPAPRVFRMNLLLDLLQANQIGTPGCMTSIDLTERGYFDDFPHDVDPLSEFNLDIMKCSRELIIQGVKDFETMSTVYCVLETVVEDSY